ncbi:MAG: NifU family protein [Acidimicrobiales bacterium]
MADATTATDVVVFTVTPEAITRILGLREAEEEPSGLALRVEITGTNGVEYAYDLSFDPIADADEADAIYQQDGLPVIVPAGSIEQLTGATLDVPAGGGQGLVLRNPNRPDPLSGKHLELTGTIAEQVEQLLKEHINPSLAAHGGFAELKGVEDGKVYVTMGGGCQGCAVSAMTLRDGIARSIKEAIPEVTEVIDTTDHDSGENPYYT